MSRCKACGAPIIWVKLRSGKMMPCDVQKIPYVADFNGELELVTEDGKVTRARLDVGSDRIGYQSHFATCPAANQFRKGENR